MPPRKSARRPRQLSCRIFHPDPDELIRALAIAFGVTPPPEPPPPPLTRASARPPTERRDAA